MTKQLLKLGWKEWLSLPGLNIPAIKAKIDTGARTSALHVFSLESFEEKGQVKVRFGVHPLQRRTDVVIWCTTDIIDEREVRDSGGHRERRFVIRTPLGIHGQVWSIEMTLTNRDDMLFRMLLGRTALRGRIVVDPGTAYLTGRSLTHYPYSSETNGFNT